MSVFVGLYFFVLLAIPITVLASLRVEDKWGPLAAGLGLEVIPGKKGVEGRYRGLHVRIMVITHSDIARSRFEVMLPDFVPKTLELQAETPETVFVKLLGQNELLIGRAEFDDAFHFLRDGS